MSDKIIYQNYSFAGNEIQDISYHKVATIGSISAIVQGQYVYETSTETLYISDVSLNWIAVGQGSISSITLSGDVTSSASTDGNVTTTVATVGGVTASAIATAVGQAHDQNTDTGTDSTSFIIDSGNVNGVTLNNNGGTLEVKNVTNSALADLRIANLYVEGTTTEIQSTVVTIGDNIITLNNEINDDALNSNGGIEIKRLQSDDTTRADASLIFNESTDRWEITYGDVTDLITTSVLGEVCLLLGDGTNDTFAINHKLYKTTVTVTVREVATGKPVEPKVTYTDNKNLTIEFKGKTPTTNEFEVCLH